MEKGKIEWISIRPKPNEITILNEVEVSVDNGLDGDHYTKRNGKRQVTIIQQEHLKTISGFLNGKEILPQNTRRNIVASGVNLISFINKEIRIGNDVVLEVTGDCPPCNNMDAAFGEGGCAAMEGMGGITARVKQGGKINIGDDIVLND